MVHEQPHSVRRLTLRTALTLSYAGVLAIAAAASALAYYHAFARQLDGDATRELREMTQALHGYLRFGAGLPALAYDTNDPEQVAFVQDATRYYQIYDASSGRLLVQSPALEPLGLHYTPNEVRAFADQPVVYDVETDRGTIRLSSSPIAAADGGKYIVQTGVPLDRRDGALRSFLTLLVWSVPVGLVAAAGVGRWMAGRALAPLARLAEAARPIGVGDLHRRLPVSAVGDELDAVADAFNEVVGRLERAVAEMKQFSAAMAHELRTPLAALRGDIEMSLTQARSPAERRRGIGNQLEQIDGLARLVSQLLTLARAEAGELPVAREAVDLAALSAAVVETMEPLAEARDIGLSCERAGAVMIAGDRGWMERLLLNLLDNSIKFTPPGGTIAVSVTQDRAAATLAVRDTGIGIAPEAIPRLFDRFYRADPARARSDGAGLGLSLVKWIADRHDAVVDVASRPGQGSTFTVRLPLDRSPQRT